MKQKCYVYPSVDAAMTDGPRPAAKPLKMAGACTDIILFKHFNAATRNAVSLLSTDSCSCATMLAKCGANTSKLRVCSNTTHSV